MAIFGFMGGLLQEKDVREYFIIALVVGVLFVTIVSIYKYFHEISDGQTVELEPISNSLVIWLALVVGALVVLSFVVLYGRPLNINNNIGQVGDFIGGLINPVLSFLALLVLLRTMRIQTSEARKTTRFLQSQQKMLELERFEGTFFQLLDRLDKYCDLHLRVADSKGDTYAGRGVQRMSEARPEFDKLSKFSQYRSSRKKCDEIFDNDIISMFVLRALRVMDHVSGSSLDLPVKRSYMGVLRDTMLPDERIIFANLSFYRSRRSREVIRLWELDYVKPAWYTCQLVSDFYHKSPKRAWH